MPNTERANSISSLLVKQAQYRINNYQMQIEETKADVDMTRLASKVLRHNISEGQKAHEDAVVKTDRMQRAIRNVHSKRSRRL